MQRLTITFAAALAALAIGSAPVIGATGQATAGRVTAIQATAEQAPVSLLQGRPRWETATATGPRTPHQLRRPPARRGR